MVGKLSERMITHKEQDSQAKWWGDIGSVDGAVVYELLDQWFSSWFLRATSRGALGQDNETL